MRMLHGDERLPQGIVHHSKRHPANIRKVAVTCLLCGTARFVLIPRGKQREKEGFTGACHTCGTGKRKDVWTHPSGALILWGKRPKGKRKQVPFICIQCGEEKVVWATQIYSTTKPWCGRCSRCIETRGSNKKFIEDKEAPSGTLTQFSKEKNGMVPILYKTCRCTQWVPRKTAIQRWAKYKAI